MARFEWKKLFTPHSILLLMLLLLGEIILSWSPVFYDVDYSIYEYRAYLEQIHGQTADEATAFLDAETKRLDTIFAENLIEEIPKAERQRPALNAVIEKQERYLACDDFSPRFFFDLDWDKRLSGGLDYFFLFGLLFVLIPFWACDCGMIREMLLTARDGKEPLLRCKLRISVIFTSGWMLLLRLTGFICFVLRYGLRDMEMPLQSLPHWESCMMPLSLLEGELLVTVVRVLWSIPAALLACAVMLYFKKAAFSVLITAGTVVLPAVMTASLPAVMTALPIGGQLGTILPQTSPNLAMSTALSAASWGLHLLLFFFCKRCWCGSHR